MKKYVNNEILIDVDDIIELLDEELSFIDISYELYREKFYEYDDEIEDEWN